MKTAYRELGFLAICLSVWVCHLHAASLTNLPPMIQESWEVISNRWGGVSFQSTKQSAEKGDVSAQYYLGCAYEDGNGVPKDMVESFKWVKLAAQQGLARAQRKLGWKYECGMGVETNLTLAREWYQTGAQSGDDFAQLCLGCMLQYGSGGLTNEMEAAVWYRKAAQQGNASAQMSLGWMYEHGKGVKQDYGEAAKWYRMAAEQGHPMAQNNLGWLYANGWGVAKDLNEADNWLQQAADKGNTYAEKNLTWLDTQIFDDQYSRARKYQMGDGVPKDPTAAFKWMNKAASHDQTKSTKVSDAIYYLALMYKNGEGIETNLIKAHDLLIQAAYGSQPDACYWVGIMCENGDGLPQDYYQASRYYYLSVFNLTGRRYRGQAAERLLKLFVENRGLTRTNQKESDYLDRELANRNDLISKLRKEVTTPTAEFYLGKIYQQGTLVSPDLVEAAARFQIAADQGVVDALKSITELDSKLSAAQKEDIAGRVRKMKNDLDISRSRERTAIEHYHW